MKPFEPGENDTRPWTTEALVSGGGDDVAVNKRICSLSRGDKSRDVCHVGHQEGTYTIRYLEK